jgi:capsular exopolysaccharide synthesis family protein
VLVVNAVHGEGTSSVAKQLAGAMVQAERSRVLLVDANLRSPSQHLTFGVRRSPGFTDVTAGAPELHTAELATSDVGFALLPVGQSQEDPVHLMRESNLASAMGELRKSYDWIVVDGPPVTIYAEAATLSSLADATVLVIRAESTRAEVADRAKRTIVESGGNLVGAILNRREYHIPEFIYRHL